MGGVTTTATTGSVGDEPLVRADDGLDADVSVSPVQNVEASRNAVVHDPETDSAGRLWLVVVTIAGLFVWGGYDG